MCVCICLLFEELREESGKVSVKPRFPASPWQLGYVEVLTLQAPKVLQEDKYHSWPEVFRRHMSSRVSVSLLVVTEGDYWLGESECHSWMSTSAGPRWPPHLTDEEPAIQKKEVTCPRSHHHPALDWNQIPSTSSPSCCCHTGPAIMHKLLATPHSVVPQLSVLLAVQKAVSSRFSSSGLPSPLIILSFLHLLPGWSDLLLILSNTKLPLLQPWEKDFRVFVLVRWALQSWPTSNHHRDKKLKWSIQP